MQFPLDRPVVVYDPPTVIERFRAIAEKVALPYFGMGVKVKIEDTPMRILQEERGLPITGLVQVIVEVQTQPRPFDPRFNLNLTPGDTFTIVFNKGIEHYYLAKMDEREMAMLLREHIVLAIVHEIDEHLLFDGKRLVETHPEGSDSFIEGPMPREVWRGRRISSPR